MSRPKSVDSYSITRGDVVLLGGGDYGSCVAEDVTGTSLLDTTEPDPGQVLTYLVQGLSTACGLGTLGPDNAVVERTNLNASACAE